MTPNDENLNITAEDLGGFIQRQINKAATSAHEASLRKNERYVLESKTFQSLVHTAREGIGITEDDIRDGLCHDGSTSELSRRIATKTKRSHYDLDLHMSQALAAIALRISKEMKLSHSWAPNIYYYILTDRPLPTKIAELRHIRVLSWHPHDSGNIVLQLERGLTRKDYLLAWRGLKDFLGQPARLSKPYLNTDSDDIYADYLEGMRQADIAAKYRGKVPADHGLDQVKKVISNMKKRRGEQ